MLRVCPSGVSVRERSMPFFARKAARLFFLGVVTSGAIFPAFAYAEGLESFVGGFRRVASEGKVTHSLSVDNDTFVLGGGDGFYSSGVDYTRQYQVREEGRTSVYAWRIGQALYTPSDIKLPPEQIAPNDRPYAAWLYAGASKKIIEADGSSRQWGVDLGCLGPCAGGEWAQETTHRIFDQALPEGWAKQVRNEVGVVLSGEQTFSPWHLASGIVVTSVIRGRFGNIFTDVSGALLLKAGEEEAAPGKSDWHGFFRLEGKAVGYNATLQGGYFSDNNPHTVDLKRWVAEAEMGIGWRRPPFAIVFSVTRRSNEIRGLPNAIGRQDYGSLQISYSP